MKKSLTVLGAAALILAAAGCGSSTESAGDAAPSSSATPPSASPSSSAGASPGASASGSAGSPGSSPSGSPSPSADSTASAIAEGFPTDIIPVMADATVLATSFEETELLTASMTASTAASVDEVMTYYTANLQRQGFTPLEGVTPDTIPSRDFVRSEGAETANIIVVPRDGTATFTVGINTLPGTK